MNSIEKAYLVVDKQRYTIHHMKLSFSIIGMEWSMFSQHRISISK